MEICFLDINECEEQTDGCDRGTSSCYNNDGSYTCRCSDGFVKDVKTGKCTGIPSNHNEWLMIAITVDSF